MSHQISTKFIIKSEKKIFLKNNVYKNNERKILCMQIIPYGTAEINTI